MKLRILLVVVVLVPAVIVALHGCTQSDDTTGQPTTLPPLVVDKNAPLLLDDEPAETEKALTAADSKNATCFVCHANYADEPFAQSHAKADIACSDCHGESIAHKNDENHLTPPEKMYPSGDIDTACRKCHASHDVQPAEVVRRWKQRSGDKKTDVLCKECHESHDIPAAAVVRKWQERTGQKVDGKSIVCTDCHGQHRLKIRSVRWNKKTRKFLTRTK